MRIGIDLLPLQYEGSRLRGVGRYAAHLVQSIWDRMGGDHQFVLYRYHKLDDPLGSDQIPSDAEICEIDQGLGDQSLRCRWSDLVQQNPHHLDLLIVTNPFELLPGYEPPPRPTSNLAVVGVVYDLIPLVFPDRYLNDPNEARRYHRRIDTIRRYDRLIAISTATGSDLSRLIGYKPSRVTVAGGAVDHHFRINIGSESIEETSKRTTPFVLHVGGRDDRKNLEGVLRGFARFVTETKSKSQLVLVGHYDDPYRERITQWAERWKITERLELLGPVSDVSLAELYRTCLAFLFPSRYEGLGLPLLEAMALGAVVIGGRNSAQVDLVGEDGFLVDPDDHRGIARALQFIEEHPEEAKAIGDRGRARVLGFSWESIGARVSVELESLQSPTDRLKTVRPQRPRIGMIGPFPPKRTGIADHGERLANALEQSMVVERFHDGDYNPTDGLRSPLAQCHDRKLLQRRRRVLGHQVTIHQLGNSWYHRSAFESLRESPRSIAILHDFCLAGFHYWYATQEGVQPNHLQEILSTQLGINPAESDQLIAEWSREEGGFQSAVNRRGIYLNQAVFEMATRVVVHSNWCQDQIRWFLPEALDRVTVVPLGAEPNQFLETSRDRSRATLQLSNDRSYFGVPGNLTKAKMYEELIEAFDLVASEIRDYDLVFAGRDWEEGDAQRLVQKKGLEKRIRFLGHLNRREYDLFATTIDVGLCLRRPPTFGETSASLLDLLRSRVPSIIADVGTFSEYPSDVVCKWSPAVDGVEGLAARMRRLAEDKDQRRQLADRGFQHVLDHHRWPIVAECYVRLIEEITEEKLGSNLARSTREQLRGVA